MVEHRSPLSTTDRWEILPSISCFCPLTGGYLLYYFSAFDAYSNFLIKIRIPAKKRILVEKTDAVTFACNAVDINLTIILNRISDRLEKYLTYVGFEVVQTALIEFLKAGGGAKCLTLRVIESFQTAFTLIKLN